MLSNVGSGTALLAIMYFQPAFLSEIGSITTMNIGFGSVFLSKNDPKLRFSQMSDPDPHYSGKSHSTYSTHFSAVYAKQSRAEDDNDEDFDRYLAPLVRYKEQKTTTKCPRNSAKLDMLF